MELAKDEEPVLACVEPGKDGLNAGENTLSAGVFAGAESAAGAVGLKAEGKMLEPVVFAAAASEVGVGDTVKSKVGNTSLALVVFPGIIYRVDA